VNPGTDQVTPAFCSVDEAARTLTISRSSAYALANEWLDSDGKGGLPCIRVGRRILVPNAVIARWAVIGLEESAGVATTPS
jgi:hypothetical protein